MLFTLILFVFPVHITSRKTLFYSTVAHLCFLRHCSSRFGFLGQILSPLLLVQKRLHLLIIVSSIHLHHGEKHITSSSYCQRICERAISVSSCSVLIEVGKLPVSISISSGSASSCTRDELMRTRLSLFFSFLLMSFLQGR